MHDENLKTKVIFKNDARAGLLKGMSIVGDAVGATLGPRGKTVIIHQKGFSPIVTKDGVTVAKSINLKDPVEHLGAELIKQAADRTNDVAGDGTTTATILTYAMVSEGNKLLNNGYNSVDLCKGINMTVLAIVDSLKSAAKKVSTVEEISQVATISANGDRKIGEIVAQAMENVGQDGIITVEDAKGMSTTLEIVEGLQFERGYLSPYFVTNTDKMHASYDNACVLITDKKLTMMSQLVPVLEQAMRAQRSLLIIADDVEGEALQTLVLNRVKNNLPVVAIKAPGYGDHRDELLSDLCVLTGTKLVSSKTGLTLEKLDLKELGTVKRFIVDAKSTTLIASGKTKESVQEAIQSLKARLEDVTLNVESVSKLKGRIAGLMAGVAIIRVGGATELEMVERKHRIEDALHATRAAAEEGIVPGGGMALLRAADASRVKSGPPDEWSRDQLAGVDIVHRACLAPLKKIVENADGSSDVIIRDSVNVPHSHGYDAVTEKFRDMFDAGIVDPVKVTRAALQHAASVATTFLMLDAVVFNEEEK